MWFDYVLLGIAVIASVPLWVMSVELWVALSHTSLSADQLEDNAQQNYKILMPAHNEADILAKTLEGLIQQRVKKRDIIVIADNCTDNTAKIAQNFGVMVLERFNDEHRGKGFALDYGIAYLKEYEHPEVVIILDADCELDKRSIVESVNKVIVSKKPIQMTNLMRVINHNSLLQKVAGFAWLVKNKIRPIAMNKLGLPVTLTGTGMAFPWKVIADINVAHGNLVEDMQLGIDCSLKGYAPIFCDQAVVYSDFPVQAEAEKTQRTRWEHGHLMTIIQQVPKLLKQAVLKKDFHLLGLALDLAVPPLSLLVLLSVLGLILLASYSFSVDHYDAFFVLLISFMTFSLLLLITWWRFGRDYLTIKELAHIPFYIISKLSIYVAFIFKRQKDWVRTERDKNR